jgi:phage N-6-adenine-methyltransferase
MIQDKTPNGKDHWRTPKAFFDLVDASFEFGLDAAADRENALCHHYCSQEQSGLDHPWFHRTWCNPPYSLKREFICKAIDERARGATSCLLLPASTATQWFHFALAFCSQFAMIKGRINFELPEREKRSGNTGGSCLFVFGDPLLRENDRWVIR